MTEFQARFFRETIAVTGFLALVLASPAGAQTIRGTLMETEVDRPIHLGEMVLVGSAGDTLDIDYTDERGLFELQSDEAGEFLVLADALGYGAMAAGVFELGEGAEMTIEYRMSPFALPIEDLVVEFDRPVRQHSLVENGFVARYNRGVGRFITPAMIEDSHALETEDLFRNIPDISVGPISTPRPTSATSDSILGGGGANSFLGDAVRLRTPAGDWCDPTLYIDGIRTENNPEMGMPLGMIVPKDQIDGIEIYRRQAEIPTEYGIGVATAGSIGNSPANFCGVLVIWTKKRGG